LASISYDDGQAHEIGVRINPATHGGRRMNFRRKDAVPVQTIMNPRDWSRKDLQVS
jgi:hypothetical protein